MLGTALINVLFNFITRIDSALTWTVLITAHILFTQIEYVSLDGNYSIFIH